MANITYFSPRGRSLKQEITPPKRVHILIACMPKSGSTFLSDIISQIPGFDRVQLLPSAGRREQELDEFCLQQVDKLSYVAQHHVRYSQWTAEMCRDYGLKPIVLVRGLTDAVVSLRDHMRRESPEFPMLFAEHSHSGLDDAALEAMIARLAAPWYVNFYMSWRRAPGALIVSYEELMTAPVKVVGDILAFSGAPTPEADIEAAVKRVRRLGESRINVGVPGRGAGLRPENIRHLAGLFDFYPEAADDAYVKAIQTQAGAALSDAPSAPPQSAAVMRTLKAKLRWLSPSPAGRKRFVARRLIPATVLTLAVLYWLWPNDLLPDTTQWGRVDDAFVLLVMGIVAGRLSKYKPRLARASDRVFAMRPDRSSVIDPAPAVLTARRTMR